MEQHLQENGVEDIFTLSASSLSLFVEYMFDYGFTGDLEHLMSLVDPEFPNEMKEVYDYVSTVNVLNLS